MGTTGARRVARGSAAAAVSTFVALLSHVAGGGAVPATIGVLVPLVLSVAVCTVLAGRRLPLARLTASVVASQALFHTLFVLGSAGGVSAAAGPTTGVGHVHSVVLTSTPEHAHSSGPGMWAAHAVAAALTIVALRRGELATARLLQIGRIALERLGVDRARRALAIRPVEFRRGIASACWRAGAVRASVPARFSALTRRGPPLAHIAV